MNLPPLIEPKRILMTTDTVGGVWTYTMELCEALAEYDVRVFLASMGKALQPDQREQVRRLSNVEMAESEFKLEWMDSPWKDVRDAGEWLLELERRFRPDVVHVNGYAHGALRFKAPKLLVAHSCVLSWWRAVKTGEPTARWNEYGRRIREGLRGADMVVAPTGAMLAALKRHYGPLAGEVISNGRNPSKFQAVQKEERILGVGRLWDAAKNVRALAEIAPQISWPVFVAGDSNGPDGQKLMIRNVEMLGRLSEDELAAQYARAAIFVSPARYEPFGLSVLEAALSECVLVLGDIPSLRELWNGVAEFVHPLDCAGLRDRIRHLIRKPTRREKLAAKARTRALEMSAQRMGAAYLSAYSDVMMASVPAAENVSLLMQEATVGSSPNLYRSAA